MLVSGGFSIRYVGLPCVSDEVCMLVSDHVCWSQTKHVGRGSPMGCLSVMLVSNGACRFETGFRWSMSRSPMGLRSGMSVSGRTPLDLRLGMSVFDGSPIGLR